MARVLKKVGTQKLNPTTLLKASKIKYTCKYGGKKQNKQQEQHCPAKNK